MIQVNALQPINALQSRTGQFIDAGNVTMLA